MKILAFETSAKAASAAVMADGKLLAECYQNTGLTHSQTLMVMAQDLLKQLNLTAKDMDTVAVAAGPGSFTGVRIGVAAAKGFAWGQEIPCVGTSTLESMALGLGAWQGYVCPVMDARRSQVYNGLFHVSGGNYARVREDRAISLANLGEELKILREPIFLVGDGSNLCYIVGKSAGARAAPGAPDAPAGRRRGSGSGADAQRGRRLFRRRSDAKLSAPESGGAGTAGTRKFKIDIKEKEIMAEVHVLDHPLIQHKLAILRSKDTPVKEFRELIGEIAGLMCYEATRKLPLKEVEVETPVATAKCHMLSGKKLAIVPVLRAGLGMVDQMVALIPSAKIGHIGLYRDPETHKPVEYYCKLPEDIANRQVFVVDPMLATGGSAVAAIDFLKKHGCRNIIMMNIIGAPEGVKAVQEAHPDVEIYLAALDEKLNEHAYIVPGLGDAGDRIFGTK